MSLYMTAEAFAALDRLEHRTWPASADWHPTRAHLPPPREPVSQPVLPDFETSCVTLARKQHTSIRSGVLRLEDAKWMPCECDECWRLFDATEVDGGEL